MRGKKIAVLTVCLIIFISCGNKLSYGFGIVKVKLDIMSLEKNILIGDVPIEVQNLTIGKTFIGIFDSWGMSCVFNNLRVMRSNAKTTPVSIIFGNVIDKGSRKCQ